MLIFDYINFDISNELEALISAESYYVTVENKQQIAKFNAIVQGNTSKKKEIDIGCYIDEKTKLARIIKIGELEIPVHPSFKFFLVSYNPNPVFNSELYGKITLVNFTVTKRGLSEQLLSVITREEAPNEEAERMNILQRQSELSEKIFTFEEEILKMLSVSNEVLLETDSLINKLEDSKRLADDAQIQMTQAKNSEERITNFRNNYLQLSQLASIIFFSIQELCLVEDVYHFSISWFVSFLLEKSIREIPNPNKQNFKERVTILKDNLLKHAYRGVCRGLYNKDKTLFAFLLLTRYLESIEVIQSADLNLLFKDLLEHNFSEVDVA